MGGARLVRPYFFWTLILMYRKSTLVGGTKGMMA